MNEDIREVLEKLGMTANIAKALMVTQVKIKGYKNPICSLSGGADSDTMLDIVARCDPEKKVRREIESREPGRKE